MPLPTWRVVLLGACLSFGCETFEAAGSAADAAGDAEEASVEGGRSYACTPRPASTFPSFEACRAALTSLVECDLVDGGAAPGAPCDTPRVFCSCQGGGSIEITLVVRDCACP